jgi:hypothetical protein
MRLLLVGVGTLALATCFDRGDRWVDPPPVDPVCTEGDKRCTPLGVERCEGLGLSARWGLEESCSDVGKICVNGLFECRTCAPDTRFCDGLDVRQCGTDGESSVFVTKCDPSIGEACRGGLCKNLCEVARAEKSNVGCEYWAVDLDNANIDATSNAAAQQFAVVVSNPHPDVPVQIVIEQDDTLPGEPNAPFEIASAAIAPQNLTVFKLGPREIDGSPEGEFDTGTHTAQTRAAYRLRTDFPVVAYQFNPLENVSVFSNDASLLYPREAVDYGVSSVALSYVALAWPQTIAITDDPNTNFNPLDPIHLRATLTIVGTTEATTVRVLPRTAVVPGGPVAETPAGGMIEATLDPFDVLNLETGDFLADFTGTEILADQPIIVFVGSEASDAPHFETLADRRCCADHLEDQLAPLRSAGKEFVIPHTPNRGEAVRASGANLEPIPEPDYVRFLATTEAGAVVETTLPPPLDRLELAGRGDFVEVEVFGDFTAKSSEPILVAQIMASQQAASVTRAGYPGGDPSLMMVPPFEQARAEYVFLTPDQYAFDFVTIVAPFTTTVLLDNLLVDESLCEVAPADGLTAEQRGEPNPRELVYRCQLSFPTVDASVDPPIIGEGLQDDGVHRIVANTPVFVAVSGWDAFVSYAYAAGTDLREIAPPQ